MNIKQNKDLGQSGEDLAANFLISNGYKIITRNYYTVYGEIDLIALYEDLIIFVEVKTRSSNHEAALNSVSAAKQKKLTNTATIFLSQNPSYAQLPTRFDVITIVHKRQTKNLRHLKDAF